MKYRTELPSGETMLVKVPGGSESEAHPVGTRVLVAIAARGVMVYRE
jgi:hypothetical protein